MKSSDFSRPLPRRDSRYKLARLLQISIAGLSALATHARRLRERVSSTRSYHSLCTHIDSLVSQLHAAMRSLAARAAALGNPIPEAELVIAHTVTGRKTMDPITAAPADLASEMIADCQACGTRLCEVMQTARAVHDQSSMEVAYDLIRLLEKELWLLRPHTAGSAHPFPFATQAV